MFHSSSWRFVGFQPFDRLRVNSVILGDDSIGHFVVASHEDRGACAEIGRQHRFYPLPVTVIGDALNLPKGEGCARRDRDRRRGGRRNCGM